jgi:hypothetical protein
LIVIEKLLIVTNSLYDLFSYLGSSTSGTELKNDLLLLRLLCGIAITAAAASSAAAAAVTKGGGWTKIIILKYLIDFDFSRSPLFALNNFQLLFK